MEREYRLAVDPGKRGVVPVDHDPQPGKRTLSGAVEWPESAAVIQRAAATAQPAGAGSPALSAMAAATRCDPARPSLAEIFGAALAPIQCKGIARDDGAASAPPVAAGAGRALPAAVQAKMERSFGADFSAVRVHEDDSAAQIGALAYTRGADIHFAPGRYEPGSQAGQELLGHELTHVVQQSQGRVSAPAQPKGAAINADPGLEREADELGARAARGELVAAGPRDSAAAAPRDSAVQAPRDSAVQAPRDSAVQAKINYDKTWAALGGYGGWHQGKQALWVLVEQQYNATFLPLIAWLDGDDASAKRAQLNKVAEVKDPLRADLVTVDQFRVHDGTNITVTVGEAIRDTLIPILNTNVTKRINDWYATQLTAQRDEVTQLKKKLTDGTDSATVHGGLDLLDDRRGFEKYKLARETIIKDLNALVLRTDPDKIADELASLTRDGGRTYDTWIDDVIAKYKLAKQQIEAARSRQRLDKQARLDREQEQLDEERGKLDALARETDTIRGWAGGSLGQLRGLYSHDELLRLTKAVSSADAGRVAAITVQVPKLDTNRARLIELLALNKGDLKGFASLMTEHGACAFALLAVDLTIKDAATVLAEPGADDFIELYKAPAVALIKSKTHAAPLAAFGALRDRSYIQEAWLTKHLKALVTLDKKLTNTPGVDHFLRGYGTAGLDALVTAPQITDRGTVDLSALREALQGGAGISYFKYDPDDTSNLDGNGAATRKKFAGDSVAELGAFDRVHDRSDKNLTRAEKLRFMKKKESDVAGFSEGDWAEYNRLKTHDDLESDDRETLEREDDKSLRDLKVKATMQIVKQSGEVLARDLQVFVSGGEHSSGYAYKGADNKIKQTGQKAPGGSLDGRTYDVTGQSRENYQHVGHKHIGHHDGSREHDAEVKIVSQTVAALKEHGKELVGATLRIFVDRYTCPNCSDLLYKAKTEDKLLGKLAAIEVIYTGART